MKKLFFSLFLSVLILPSQAQEKQRKHTILRVAYESGYVLPLGDFVQGDNAAGSPIEYFQAGAIELGWQSDGTEDWQHMYKLPNYGIGIYTADFYNDDELGQPNAIYGWWSAPYKRWRRSDLRAKLGFGLAWNWQAFDQFENPWQNIIGSQRTVYIEAGLHYNYYLSSRWELLGGFDFVHFSNGKTTVPNVGINTVAPRVTVQYNFNKEPIDYEHIKKIGEEIPKYDKSNEVYFVLAGGVKNVKFDTTGGTDPEATFLNEYYGIGNFSAAYQRQLHWKHKIGGGLDISYDGTHGVTVNVDTVNQTWEKVDPPAGQKVYVGLYFSYEWVMHRWSVILQPGYVIYRTEFPNLVSKFYQRAGLRYGFGKDYRYFAGINIRATNFSVADYIEWAVGYRIKWR